ncbi:39S ribosomal protein L33, mitochondrial [Trachymyrmex septentrionalis]|uniref:39S ribosomal protein L33, mitochondrial n=1 Tax=Trachymyrmex septentrionalis TaxID=34720 RepID=A0A195FH22_9HYME|nr:39S ribosomal protein L33, mitochondrial [Trachymyrmex septentrionalis]
MFLTNILLKKAKSKHVLVLTQSVVTGHRLVRIRERLADKLEFTAFDPYSKKRKRGKRRIGERPAKSLDVEIGGRFPLILNKEHKVVLFPPGFQTVQDPPGVKHDPPSLSLRRDYILERESSLSFAIVRVTAREGRNLHHFFPSLSFSLSLSLSLSFSLKKVLLPGYARTHAELRKPTIVRQAF